MLSIPEGFALFGSVAAVLLLIASAGPLVLVIAFSGSQFGFRSRDDDGDAEGVQPTLGIDGQEENYGALTLDTEEAKGRPADERK